MPSVIDVRALRRQSLYPTELRRHIRIIYWNVGASGLLACSDVMVEAGGVEPPSENTSTKTSPGADGYPGSLALPVPLPPGKPSRLGVG